MPDTIQSLLIGGVAGAVSAVITYFSTRSKIRLDLAAEYDKALQEARLATYKELWSELEPLARYGREGPVTFKIIGEISDFSRTWYFKTGGIYLTERSRSPYFRWKAVMQPVLDSPDFTAKPDAEIDKAQLELILAAGSTLRTALSDDLHTKRLSRI